MSFEQRRRDPVPAQALAEQACEFLLDIVTGSDSDDPAAVVWFRACSVEAAIEQARRFLSAHLGHADRYGELYQRNGELGDFLTTVHLGG